jgi:hypothetical protein
MKGEKRRKEKIVPPHPFPIEESAEALGEGVLLGSANASQKEKKERKREKRFCALKI